MRNLKQNTAANIMVLMVDSTDHITGKTGLSLTITASKDGAAFAAITPTVTERGSGWYNLALTTTHLNTLGDLALHVTGAAADASDVLCRVVAGSLDADVSTRMATFTYTAPDNAGIASIYAVLDTEIGAILAAVDTEVAAIKQKTDNLPADPASNTQVNTRMATFAYTAPPAAAENAAQVLAVLVATAIPVDLVKVKGQPIDGAGTEMDPWGPV